MLPGFGSAGSVSRGPRYFPLCITHVIRREKDLHPRPTLLRPPCLHAEGFLTGAVATGASPGARWQVHILQMSTGAPCAPPP